MASPRRDVDSVDLSLATVDAYLRMRGLLDGQTAVEYRELSGGISNTVLRAVLSDDCFVVKQSLPKLRVADEWFFDRRRIFVERDCMAALGELLPAGSVPAVRFSDESNFVLGMSCAPAGGEIWKDVLFAGRAEVTTAKQAARMLALIHCESMARPDLLDRFRDQSLLIQGRIDPYHRMAAQRHPDLEPIISAEVERLLDTQLALVHGDYSPKNIVVYPQHILILDFEVAHWGDPAFDVAFCMTHLVLKATHFPAQQADHLECALAFWNTYERAVGRTFGDGLASSVVAELGCLLLARIDGKSKIEYIKDESTREFVRHLARHLLVAPPQDPQAAINWVGGEIPTR